MLGVTSIRKVWARTVEKPGFEGYPTEYRVEVSREEVTFSESDRYSGGNTRSTHAEFLAGAMHDEIAAVFGLSTLREILGNVGQARGDPAFGKERDAALTLQRAISALPFDPTLRSGLREPVENGLMNIWATEGVGLVQRHFSEIVLMSGSLRVSFDKDWHLWIRSNRGGGPAFESTDYVFAAVVQNRYLYYLGEASSFHVRDDTGQRVFTAPGYWATGDSQWPPGLSFVNIYLFSVGARIVAEYEAEGRNGLLAFESEKGFTARGKV